MVFSQIPQTLIQVIYFLNKIFFSSKLDFSEFAKKMFGRLQDLIKDSYISMKSNIKVETNAKEIFKGKIDIVNQIDNEFRDKSEKIKVRIT